jgi:hypothetical protein
MPAKKLHDEKLDRLLSESLCKYTTISPADFTGRVMTQIRQQQEREILTQIVLKERLALAACVIAVMGIIFAAIALPQASWGITEGFKIIANEIPIVIEALINAWSLFVAFAAFLAFVVYIFVKEAAADNQFQNWF